ncbi:cyclic nucleotide-binding/CBS domain-containing protein [Blastococcus saxobsidens]|uniref:CBS domain protein n=1 Tax=Blastococcus saxobsidens TaxID=138336 RepID=A0A4Q7Y5D6_9ACTN|nr:CBS domain-containing protein [Blastococcus saxobsidens]RZU32187.1 CBS domain protein [Blastococcus saxobsidens]
MADKHILASAVQTVAQLMRPPTATIEPAAHLAAAAYLIKHRHASVLVVTTDDHDPVAMISDEDVAHAVADGRDPERTRVRQVARQRPVTVDSHAAAADAARLMLAQGVQHLLVEEGERLVGIVDLNEVCQAAPDTCGCREAAPNSSRSS